MSSLAPLPAWVCRANVAQALASTVKVVLEDSSIFKVYHPVDRMRAAARLRIPFRCAACATKVDPADDRCTRCYERTQVF